MVVTVVKIESRSFSLAEIQYLELKIRGVIITIENTLFICGLHACRYKLLYKTGRSV